jgi:hypothetical protein
MALYQHRFQGVLPAGDIFVFSWWSESSVTIDTAQGKAVQWAADFWAGESGTNGYGSLCTAGVVLQRVSTGEITMATGQQQSLRETDVTHAGTATGSALPGDVALVVSLRTALANRSGRGRFYLPQPAASALADDGRVATAAQTAVADAAAFAWTGSNDSLGPVVYSRTKRTTQVISTFNVGNLFDTQRRRENALVEVRTSRTMP